VCEVRELRAILVEASPFLADLIRRVAEARLRVAGVSLEVTAEFESIEDARERLSGLTADIAIFGGAQATPAAIEGWPTPMLGLSADLTLIYGPGEADVVSLTPENLALRLVEFTKRSGT
jgi:hypothetical protein